MPCHVPATSVSCRRRTHYQKRPPAPLAQLDLSKPGEAWAEDYLRRACSGRSPMWRLLDLRRDESSLRVAVRWMKCDDQGPFSVVTLSLVEMALHWNYFDSETAARKALADTPAMKSAEASTTLGSRRNRTKQRPSR